MTRARRPFPAACLAALADLPFCDDAFSPFLADLAAARSAPPLRLADLTGTPGSRPSSETPAKSSIGLKPSRPAYSVALMALVCEASSSV